MQIWRTVLSSIQLIMGLDATNPVFGVSDHVILKSAYPATETSLNIEISLLASLELANDKGADQTARMRRLVCAFVVRKSPETGFLLLRGLIILKQRSSPKLHIFINKDTFHTLAHHWHLFFA